MIFTENIHLKFASYFGEPKLIPYIYLLSKKLAEGSICVTLDKIDTTDLEELPSFILDKFSDKIPQSKLIGKPGDYLPFIKEDNRLYLQRYYNYETQIVNRINDLVHQDTEKLKARNKELINHKTFIQQLFSNSTNTDWQYIATINTLLNNLSIITGGPGTGKTTTVAKILSVLLNINPNTKIALAAPTGKAAARMAESLSNTSIDVATELKQQLKSITPLTIHRLLGAVKGSIYFKHNANNPINADVIVIDECSMIDAALFAKLLSAINDNTRIILLGDKDQLSSVEAGSLFGDICETVSNINTFSSDRNKMIASISNTMLQNEEAVQFKNNTLSDNIVQLKVSYRFNENSGIGKLSKAILNNNIDVIEEYLAHQKDKTVMIDTEYIENILHRFLDGYVDYIREEDTLKALQLLDNQRILCAVKEGDNGVHQMNVSAENYLSKKIKNFRKDSIFYHNRPIIVTQNNYTLGLFNGDIGIIRKDENGKPLAWFYDNESPNKLKSIQPGIIQNMETVFAMTIHKSQGSEFDNVMVVLPANEDNKILSRELLYTGVTRAKSTVCIQSSKESLLTACSQRIQRSSGIIDRL